QRRDHDRPEDGARLSAQADQQGTQRSIDGALIVARRATAQNIPQEMETGSMLAAERGEEPAAAQPAPEPGDGEPVFRVVMARGGRKGIRLERIFWRVVSDLAAARRETLGTVVADAADNVPANGNLASTLRVQAARWLQDRLTELERLTAAENVYSIVHATPSPAFVLTADKRIVRYNQPFLNFRQARLLASQSPDLMRAVRLTLDLHVEQVIEQLL